MTRIALLALAAFAPASTAAALDLAVGKASFEAGAATDYVSKGISKTRGEPQVYGGVKWTRDAVYASAWASNVDMSAGGDAEIVLTAGVTPKLAETSFNFAAIYKTYPNTLPGLREDMWEWRAEASRAFGPVKLRLRTDYSADNYGSAEEAWWVETQAGWKLDDRTELGAGFGVRDQDGGADYRAWSVGVKRALSDHAALDVRWWDTDRRELGVAYEGRLAADLKITF